MKQYLSALLFCLTATFVFAGSSSPAVDNNSQGNLMRSSFTIDMYDTVVFDISQSTMAGNQVSFPVYIISDDTINALDFSLVFDETNFSLDTIINLTTYLQPVYNLTMGTLYFTSYSLQDVDHNTPLVSIRLNMLGHYLCSDDLNSVLVYLNGDPCSVKVIECLSDKISEFNNENNQHVVYPSPATEMLNIKSQENTMVQLFDIEASKVIFQSALQANQILQISTMDITPGIYLVKFSNDDFVSVKKVIIN